LITIIDVCIVSLSAAEAVYIGVHIRRTDMVHDPKYTVADVRYFRRAVHFMARNFLKSQLVFVVCSDDIHWSKQKFPNAVLQTIEDGQIIVAGNDGNGDAKTAKGNVTARRTVIVFSEDQVPEVDLAILSSCNHTIMTVGTYGWWGAYLAGGLTTYLRNFPAKNGELYSGFSRQDHFLPEWVGL